MDGKFHKFPVIRFPLSKCLSFVTSSILLSRAVVLPVRAFAVVSDGTFASSEGNGVRTVPPCIPTNHSNVIHSLLNPTTFNFYCSDDVVVACAVMVLLAGGLPACSLRPPWVDQPTTKHSSLRRPPNWLRNVKDHRRRALSSLHAASTRSMVALFGTDCPFWHVGGKETRLISDGFLGFRFDVILPSWIRKTPSFAPPSSMTSFERGRDASASIFQPMLGFFPSTHT